MSTGPLSPEDRQIRENAKELLGPYYDALLREGRTPDEALDEVAAASRKTRAEWEAAKAADQEQSGMARAGQLPSASRRRMDGGGSTRHRGVL